MVQTLAATSEFENLRKFWEGLYRYLQDTQLKDDPPERQRYYRDPWKGGWTFTGAKPGWASVDSTAEALKACLLLEARIAEPIPHHRLVDTVDLLLVWQNAHGGWPTYERSRGSRYLELLNPSDLFSNIMIDYSTLKVTSSCVQALVAAKEHLPGLGSERLQRIDRALDLGNRYIRRKQRGDGSWEGFWGICFTCGTWFAVEGLLSTGFPPNDPAIERAGTFLLSKQRPDGGWSESFWSSVKREYTEHPDGRLDVQTSWALLALFEGKNPSWRSAIQCGLRFLVERQLPDGDWPQRAVSGAFMRNCVLNYRFYRNYFPVRTLAGAERLGFPILTERQPLVSDAAVSPPPPAQLQRIQRSCGSRRHEAATEAHGSGGRRVSTGVPHLRRRHPNNCAHHGAGADPEDSHTPRRTTRAASGLSQSRTARRLGRARASTR